MQQHSSQHLISAIAEQKFGWETASWWLGDTLCNIEFKITKKEHQVTEKTLEILNNEVNQIIRENQIVTTKIIEENEKTNDQNDEKQINDRKSSDRHHGSLRVVSIGNIDQNQCCGTHISHTSELQVIFILKTFEKARGNIKIFFHAGNRAINAMNEMFKRETHLKSILSCGPEEHINMIKKMQNDHKNLLKLNKSLWSEIAEFKAKKLLDNQCNKNHNVISFVQNDCDVSFLSSVAFNVLENSPCSICFFVCKNGDDCLFLLQSSNDDITSYGKHIATILDGRGGGKQNRFQGKIKNLDKFEEACEYLENNFLKET